MPKETKGTGKWVEAGVPHLGWSCVDVEDVEDALEICEMCEAREIRFVHCMTNPRYDSELRVGCICAGYMEGSLARAAEREKGVRNVAARRRNWLTRAWKHSAAGNDYLNTDGLNMSIYRQADGSWGARLLHRETGWKKSSRRRYITAEAAKMAAFDEMIRVLASRPWRSG